MNQKTIIIILAVVAIIVLGGGYYVYAKNSSSQKHVQPTPADTSDVVPTLAPEDIGLALKESDSGKFAGHGVVMTISKLNGISSVECEFTYIANTGSDNLPRGGICKSVTVKSGDTQIQQEYPYGTCSNVCHFDSDVSAVKMIVKVTKTDGKTYEVTKSL